MKLSTRSATLGLLLLAGTVPMLMQNATYTWTKSLSSGCVRCNMNSTVGFLPGSSSRIRNVSSDQMMSPLKTLHPKLPVRLALCASAR